MSSSSFQLGTDKIRGVNLGGWLVLEPWITPSLFDSKPDWVIDENTYGAYWRSTNYTRGIDEIQEHWQTWIQYADLKNIKELGLNVVRIPIGYWSIIPLNPDEPHMTGAFWYLQQAVGWARDLGLGVMIDLHGVPGGQNGFDNSGLTNNRNWFFSQPSLTRTLSALQTLISEFSSPAYGSALIALELVNEPFPFTDPELEWLKTFYYQGYDTVRAVSPGVGVVLSEAFKGVEEWQGFMPQGEFGRVLLDTHIYAMFSIDLIEQGYTDHLKTYCDYIPSLTQSDRNLWTVVGEFTTASTDCAAYLNGRGRGARWDSSMTPNPTNLTGNCDGKTGSAASFSADYTDYLARSFETQTYVYEQASGWIYWTWKTESASEWAFQDGVTYGWIPQPLWDKPATLGRPCQFNGTAPAIRPASNAAQFLAPSKETYLHFLLYAVLLLVVLK